MWIKSARSQVVKINKPTTFRGHIPIWEKIRAPRLLNEGAPYLCAFNQNRPVKDLFYFFKDNFRTVGYGWLLTFFSGFGQTFLISLYVPEIVRDFSITEGTFGAMYAGCTVLASIAMLGVGHYVDHWPVKKVTALTILCLALSCLLLGLSYNIAFLLMALTGLRLAGQGLLSHISLTVISRYFKQNRGKALSISSLGYAVGEGVLPLIIAFIIGWFDWRAAAVACGGFLVLYLIRLKGTNLGHFDQHLSTAYKPSGRTLMADYKHIIREKKFWIIMPASMAQSFIITAVFFYQYVFVEDKGWSVQLYASFFAVYAVTRFVCSLIGGLWVDKYSARVLFRYFLIPFTLGMLPFAFIEHITGALIFLVMAGMTTGIAGTVKTALIAELYGTEKMGTIRSIYSMFMVLSTALGPFIIGILIDQAISFFHIILMMFGVLVLVILNSQRIIQLKSPSSS